MQSCDNVNGVLTRLCALESPAADAMLCCASMAILSSRHMALVAVEPQLPPLDVESVIIVLILNWLGSLAYRLARRF